MTEGKARLIVEKRASGQLRARIRLCDQRVPPPRVAAGGALSEHQNLQMDSETGELLRKAKTIRLEAKRLIMEYASAIERTYTKSNCLFLTGTLPGSSLASVEVFSAWQKNIQRRLRQWLADLCACSVAAVIVWEYQKRGALHVHLLVGCDSLQQARQIRRNWRRYWVGLLERISTESGVDMFERSDGRSWRTMKHAVRAWAQPVRKGVSAYLAKYLSKSKPANIPATACEPSRLWGATQKARSLLRSCTSFARTAAISLDDARAAFKLVLDLCSAAAVPTFTWTRRFSPSEQAMAACFTWGSDDRAFETLKARLSFDEGAVLELHTQATVNAPAPPYPELVRLVFRGKLITSEDSS